VRDLKFTKMQGLGNDFVVLDGPQELSGDEIAWLCDRRFGVGADGVLVATPGDPIRMEYWNADGSPAEMCGNGLRCVARSAFDCEWVDRSEFVVATSVGPRWVRVHAGEVEVELGEPRVGERRTVDGLDCQLVEVGNPHAVRFVEDPADVDVQGVGASLQREFPDGINVEFVSIGDDMLTMRVWERGVGETLACGTGMVAAAAAAQPSADAVTVRVPGGVGIVRLDQATAWLSGPAEYVFSGTVGGR
jgi:diaminopimelate epimerase